MGNKLNPEEYGVTVHKAQSGLDVWEVRVHGIFLDNFDRKYQAKERAEHYAFLLRGLR